MSENHITREIVEFGQLHCKRLLMRHNNFLQILESHMEKEELGIPCHSLQNCTHNLEIAVIEFTFNVLKKSPFRPLQMTTAAEEILILRVEAKAGWIPIQTIILVIYAQSERFNQWTLKCFQFLRSNFMFAF